MSERFTERQAKAWQEDIAPILEAHGVTSASPFQLFSHWHIQWGEEVRPGRGHHFNGIYVDGEVAVQVLMDVYGQPSVSVADLDWVHADSDEDRFCETCRECPGCIGRFGEHEDDCPKKPHKHKMVFDGRDARGLRVFYCDVCEHEEHVDLWKKTRVETVRVGDALVDTLQWIPPLARKD